MFFETHFNAHKSNENDKLFAVDYLLSMRILNPYVGTHFRKPKMQTYFLSIAAK